MRRAKHNLSHYRVTAGDFGKLYPYSSIEVLPGDTFRMQSSALIRIQPLMTPLMHPVDVSIAHFFVPTRLVHSNFERVITGRNSSGPGSTIAQLTGVTAGDINDYMGCAITSTGKVTSTSTRCYNMIWNEFYRDQQLDNLRNEDDTSVARVRWSKDYFTTARPQPQKGESVQIQFSTGEAPVTGLGTKTDMAFGSNTYRETGGIETTGTAGSVNASSQTTQGIFVQEDPNNAGYPYVRADLSNATGGIDINDWRRAMATQRFLEHRNKFGDRYKDLLASLGVRSADSRLDRPEYIGGGRQTISFSEVLATTETNDTPLGTLGGHGIASIRTRSSRRMFTEHGHVITLLSIRPKSIYLTGTDRTFLREVRDDYWQKEDEMLGDQPVLKREIYGEPADENTPFGYSPRHDDYRTQRSYATGPMRDSSYSTWHMARDFQSEPALNADFVECSPTDRVFRSTKDPQFYAMVQNRISARRLVSRYARN